ncbi:hypothetical protein CGRA01v4_03316 [Colletotrichum graminicola]|nr:hypothetical protein CGRA01v4_03316 [Colletotrichum graminicola]
MASPSLVLQGRFSKICRRKPGRERARDRLILMTNPPPPPCPILPTVPP